VVWDSEVEGNAPEVAKKVLQGIASNNSRQVSRTSYVQGIYLFHVLVSDGISFICMAEEDFGRRVPFVFLEDVRQSFTAKYGTQALHAAAYAFNEEFSRVLNQKMNYYNTNPQADTIGRVRKEISEVKNIMVENIELVLERGEKIDLLVDKTDSLQDETFRFRRQARRIKQEMWWRSMRMTILLIIVVFLGLYFVLALACGPRLKNC